jgi:anti-sigma factor RsiW
MKEQYHMMAHFSETDLALFVSGDLSLWRGAVVRFHIAGCERCRRVTQEFRADRERLRRVASELPASLDWDRLAAEMTANIHLGLSAGECVAPRRRKSPVMSWRPAAIMAGAALMLAAGWWLNMPPSTTKALGRALTAVIHGPSGVADDLGMVVSASDKGIELRENGTSLGISQGSAPPLSVSVSVQGSASARYIDTETGQVTITSVSYAQ